MTKEYLVRYRQVTPTGFVYGQIDFATEEGASRFASETAENGTFLGSELLVDEIDVFEREIGDWVKIDVAQ